MLYTMVGSLLMLVAIIYLYVHYRRPRRSGPSTTPRSRRW